jgi:hypothetical protein
MVKTIAFGFFPKGLSLPYSLALSPDFVTSVLDDARDTNASCISTFIDFARPLRSAYRQGDLDIRLTGIWQDKCIAMAASSAVSQGFNVDVPKDLVHPYSQLAVSFEDMVRYQMPSLKLDYQFDGKSHLFVPK